MTPLTRKRVTTSDGRIGYHMIQSVDGPLVVCPPDADGYREALTIQQAQKLLTEKLGENEGWCEGDGCEACDLYDLLNGIR